MPETNIEHNRTAFPVNINANKNKNKIIAQITWKWIHRRLKRPFQASSQIQNPQEELSRGRHRKNHSRGGIDLFLKKAVKFP